MLDKFLNFYSKYPWVGIVIVVHWLATAFMIIYSENIDVTTVLGVAFFSTIVFAYFGFKITKA
ncbi:hypothetical protein A3C98_02470 [Candidatus Roizmanbacteria bacterium RIFCSPHIGHO2_02_FULL_37_15]|uniref:Uncharacterized protein n=1 Tax=Candidatus Roizmanbacteria bacterium RIFCSPLOWO2_01_FULL_37_16 TaxID=1802058 RepID=A0A1F7INL8_9BACT|nr:MAG: hypothetical protein A2859_01960 [Candidatus Roizmanbacteria bacterium RIFCSPHIGHO2_01_FULL_37_16b]OGK21440.1 MAG: hypothetical protein A3C98_02470 [Candidatus Roizmanbacteria bacterium RIFCSPHIGHO2_02_FULL_37_15]OGK32404.1 MAG: hypothetical protein A3F57_04875 [Candidatus Roizmanbacteria bacterium RIFCSPHIGHO2_12_FULL_36_11]OGK44949.1 MAG: hypothetical protein A3B40_04155 [Candidatus Roizmanbacteria bacterium RIFCSPLOWO2_01_FULL_37_16]